MFVEVDDDDLGEIPRAWAKLEAVVGSLRGRRFFGAFDPATNTYRACVALRDGDDPAALGLEAGTLPGGRYLRARLAGEPPAVYGRIGATFEELAQRIDPDLSRPSIEHYRRRDEIELLLPV